MKRICVYCGSNPGADPAFAKAARELGRILADRGLGLVYGAGNVGLMGIIADAVLEAGGEVTGFIPKALEEKELAHTGITELVVVDSMHERKQLMADRADGFIAMPGGVGTLEEVIEVFTWLQLRFHAKPIGLLNIAGFYDPLMTFLEKICEQKFLKREQLDMLIVSDSPAELLDRFAAFKPATADKWFEHREES